MRACGRACVCPCARTCVRAKGGVERTSGCCMPGANEKAGLQASQLYTVIFPDVVGIVLLSATRHFPNSATRPNVNFRRRDHPVPRLKIENGLSDRDRSADRVTWVPSRSGTGASTIREAQRCRLEYLRRHLHLQALPEDRCAPPPAP